MHLAPTGPGVRLDSGIYAGTQVSPYYDPMLSKLVVWGRDRDEAIARMKRALYEYVLTGGANNIAFHQAVMQNPRFVRGELDTHFIETETGLMDDMRELAARERPLAEKLAAGGDDRARVAAVAAAVAATQLLQRS